MHAGQRSMCGVIVVDTGRSRSTCHGHDAYIQDYCLICRHNFAFLYQLLNSNLFTHHMCSYKREASSQTYGPRVYFPSYYFQIYKTKNPKIPCCNLYLFLLYFAFYLSFVPISIRSHSCKWPWRDWQPLLLVECKCLLVCVRISETCLCLLLDWYLGS